MPPRSGGPSGRTKYTVDAVARAVDLLRAFAREPNEFGVTELARDLGLTKNLAFRLLKTLEERGFVHRRGKRYVLGAAVAELGHFALHRFDAVRIAAKPVLADLRDRSGETAYVACREGSRAICIAVAESEEQVQVVMHVGATYPLHIGGATKALLAHMPPDEIEAVIARGLAAHTRRTITDPAALRRRLARIRANGYEVADEDATTWAAAIGAPVFDSSGTVCAALGIFGLAPRIRSRRAELVTIVVRAAAQVSAAVAHAPNASHTPKSAFAGSGVGVRLG